MSRPRQVVLLGATGSIGGNTLHVLRQNKDRLRLLGVAAATSHRELAAICREFEVPYAALTDPASYREARAGDDFPANTRLHGGEGALAEIATLPEADVVLVAVVGARGLEPALAAIEAGKDLALANKELLVLGGRFVMEAARRRGVRLLPTDSEHNAIFQCLEGRPQAHIGKLILTASGGQFRDHPLESLAHVTPEDATRHPNWSMGPKITVDSATMANKGLELIEAHWLFGVEPEKLEVVLHPQSIVHSFVQFTDGSILAQLCPPSMTFAIQHCLLHPGRGAPPEPTLDFQNALRFDFAPPPPERYPCLRLARAALSGGGAAPAVFNAANEIAVERFLAKQLPYLAIPSVIEQVLEAFQPAAPEGVDALLQIDAEARRRARQCSATAAANPTAD